jgi:hypothetical protein
MPIEAAAFFAGATGLILWTGVSAGLFGYVRGYAAGVKDAKAAYQPPKISFEQPTQETLAAQYEAWKAAQQPERSDA